MAIAVIRYSVSGESSNKTGNEVKKVLEAGGFHRVGTAGFSGVGEAANLSATLRSALQVLEAMPGRGTLDSLWINLYHTEVNDTLSFAESVS